MKYRVTRKMPEAPQELRRAKLLWVFDRLDSKGQDLLYRFACALHTRQPCREGE